VRLATLGEEDFRLGSTDIEQQVAGLLEPCETCGGRLQPGGSDGAIAQPAFDSAALQPVATVGWDALTRSQDPRLQELARVWKARAYRACGREHELTADEQHELRVENRLERLLLDAERARAAGDQDAADTAQARYVELGTMYVQRFVRGSEPSHHHG